MESWDALGSMAGPGRVVGRGRQGWDSMGSGEELMLAPSAGHGGKDLHLGPRRICMALAGISRRTLGNG